MKMDSLRNATKPY